MKSFLRIALGVLFVTAAAVQADDQKEKTKPEKSPVVHVDAAAAAKLLAEKDEKKRPVVIDIRTDEEFKAGHIEGAKQIDFLGDDFKEKVSKLDRKKPYVVHCRSGGRSTRSLAIWKELGFQKIYHLDGGMIAWEEADLPVKK